MPLLNKGKTNVGSVTMHSFGTQSPELDAVPLSWNVTDFRTYVGVSPTILGWRCIAAGTPGTWIEISVGGGTPSPPRVTIPFLFQGNADGLVGTNTYAAPATADWLDEGEGNDVYNLWYPPTSVLGLITHMTLSAYLTVNAPGVTVPDGIVLSVVDPTGTIVDAGATATINADPLSFGNFQLFDLDVSGIDVTEGVALKVNVDAGVGTFAWFVTFMLDLTFSGSP